MEGFLLLWSEEEEDADERVLRVVVPEEEDIIGASVVGVLEIRKCR